MSRFDESSDSDLIRRARAFARYCVTVESEHLVGDLVDALANRLEKLTKVQDPCPECGENMIPLQKGSTRWSCKNNHLQERSQ